MYIYHNRYWRKISERQGICKSVIEIYSDETRKSVIGQCLWNISGLTRRRVWIYQNVQSEFVYRRRADNTLAKRKSTKDKQRSTKHTYKTTDRVTRTPLKTGNEIRCSGRVGSSCSTTSTRRVNLVRNPVIT